MNNFDTKEFLISRTTFGEEFKSILKDESTSNILQRDVKEEYTKVLFNEVSYFHNREFASVVKFVQESVMDVLAARFAQVALKKRLNIEVNLPSNIIDDNEFC